MLDTVLIHLSHPCRGHDLHDAKTEEDVEVCKPQGYYTLGEIIELAKDALVARDQTCPVCENPYMHLLTDNKYFCEDCGYFQP